MATDNFVFSGKTVDEAVAEGLRILKLTMDQVEVEVVNKGSRGIFGLGSEPAVVRLQPRLVTPPSSPRPAVVSPTEIVAEQMIEAPPTTAEQSSLSSAPVSMAAEHAPLPAARAVEETESVDQQVVAEEEPAVRDEEVEEIAVQLLSETVNLMGFQATVVTTWREGNDELSEHSDRYLLLDVQGGDLGSLIGRRGEGLENLQYLLRLMVNQRLRRWKNIVVDVEGYKERRISQLKQLAQRTATQVAATGRAVSLEPMPPNERRIIHLTLREHAEVYTESSGEGERRKVQIFSKNH